MWLRQMDLSALCPDGIAIIGGPRHIGRQKKFAKMPLSIAINPAAS